MGKCRICLSIDTVTKAYYTREANLLKIIASNYPTNPKFFEAHTRKVKNAQKYLKEMRKIKEVIERHPITTSIYFSRPSFEKDVKIAGSSKIYFKGEFIEVNKVFLLGFTLYFIHMAPLSKL